MVNRETTKCGGHSRYGIGDIIFSVDEEQDSTSSCLNSPLLCLKHVTQRIMLINRMLISCV